MRVPVIGNCGALPGEAPNATTCPTKIVVKTNFENICDQRLLFNRDLVQFACSNRCNSQMFSELS